MYHMYAAKAYVYTAPRVGITTMVLPGFKLDLYLSTIQKYRITVSASSLYLPSLDLTAELALLVWPHSRFFFSLVYLENG
jgi:hypothetical protein